jgi:hypothetical protein
MEKKGSFKDSFKNELEAISNDPILAPTYRRKKLILWTIRTTFSIILYVFLWKHEWVKWTLILTVPLSLFSLFIIAAGPYFLKQKIERTRQNIERTDSIISETPNE